MSFVRVILLLLASLRLLQPSGVCGCKVVKMAQSVACLDDHGETDSCCHCCLGELEGEHSLTTLTGTHPDSEPVAPTGHLPGKNCVGLVSTTPGLPGVEKADWVLPAALVENVALVDLARAGRECPHGLESGPPPRDSLPRLFLLNCSILL